MSLTRIACLIGCLNSICLADESSAATELRCRSVSFSGQIHAGEKFAKEFGGGLALMLTPQKFSNEPETPSADLWGWRIGVYPAVPKTASQAVSDFIYPVNPPLRFNPWQNIGTSYDLIAEEMLRQPTRYDFILNWPDYRKMTMRVTDALWPYAANDPDLATSNYFTALNGLQLGRIQFSPVRSVTADKGMSILELEFRVQIIAPSTFPFLRTLASRPSACPAERT